MTDEQDHQSWDDFWAEVAPPRRTEVIRGVQVEIPTNLPLTFDRRLAEVQAAGAEDGYRQLLAEIFGVDVLDAWADAGMGHLELQTVLTWAIANGQGRQLTPAEAYQLVQDAAAGKAPAPANRAARRLSAASGGRSKRTSSGSTASARRRSAS